MYFDGNGDYITAPVSVVSLLSVISLLFIFGQLILISTS